jgi:dipeptidyl-peptidase-4
MRSILFVIAALTFTVSFAQEITVEKIWKTYEYYGNSVDGFRSMRDGNYFSKKSKLENGTGVTKHRFDDYQGSGEVLIDPKLIESIKMDNYFFNSDETKVLISTNTKSIYRRSFSAEYYLLDLKTQELQPLDETHSPQTLAEYSPDGTMVSYVHGNNLYVKNIANGKIIQLTHDGEKNSIINGTTDWVYEEEFAITKAYGWSPDSKYIAFLRFDESSVPEYTMKYFHELYPDLYTFKYPKAGEVNSIVTAHVMTIDGSLKEKIDLGSYEYIPRLKWSGSNNDLIIQTMNRHQNQLNYHRTTVSNGKVSTKMFYEESSDTYIDIDDNLLILKDGKTILRTSEKDGYNHIYKLTFDGQLTQITKGNWDVIEFLGIDDANKTIYYSSAFYGPIYKTIHKVKINGKGSKCISSETGYNSAQFSNGMKYFSLTHSSANSPACYSLCDNNGKELAILEQNSDLKNKLSAMNLPEKEFMKFKGHELELNGWIIKPKGFDPSKKYPVYINIYGGPGSNTVSDSWGGFNYMYHQLLAQHGYIVVSVDPRGTMYRGEKFKKSTYLQLGKLETEDFIAVAKELKSMDFVDPERIGIMGWSYGGFMTSLAMTKGADDFKMGIAVAPVTNWRYYDNIYTERFMRTPQENASGYDDNSPITLVAADKQFDLFIYPNKNHGIYGGNTRNHLFKMMLNYTLENL